MIPTYIIEEAIAGGWSNYPTKWEYDDYTFESFDVDGILLHRVVASEIALDPDFWMALGKEMGWDDEGAMDVMQDWHGYAHKFYNIILRKASQAEINSFWDALTPTP